MVAEIKYVVQSKFILEAVTLLYHIKMSGMIHWVQDPYGSTCCCCWLPHCAMLLCYGKQRVKPGLSQMQEESSITETWSWALYQQSLRLFTCIILWWIVGNLWCTWPVGLFLKLLIHYTTRKALLCLWTLFGITRDRKTCTIYCTHYFCVPQLWMWQHCSCSLTD